MTHETRRTLTSIAAFGLSVGCIVAPGLASAAGSVAIARPRRVLVVSIPRVTWSDIVATRPPALLSLLDRSALASMSVPSTGSPTSLGGDYASIGSGNTARADPPDEGLAFGSTEVFGRAAATATYSYRTGWSPERAATLQLAIANIIRVNKKQLHGAVPGSLGSALGRAGWHRAVIGNDDSSLDPLPEPDRSSASLGGAATAFAAGFGAQVAVRPNAPIALDRPLALALMDQQGRVPEGDVARDLLGRDPRSPFGLHSKPGGYLKAFRRAWRDRSVVLVEFSDLERADRYAANETAGRAVLARRRLLLEGDQLLSAIVRSVDLSHDLVFVVSPAAPRSSEEPTPFAVAGAGVHKGVTASGTTRRSGYVTLPDVAPTILRRLGIAQPPQMNGAPISTGGSGTTGLRRYRKFVAMNEQTRFRDRVAAPVIAWFIVFELIGYAVAVVSMTRRWRWLRSWAALFVLTTMAFPTVTFVFGLGRADHLTYPMFTLSCFVASIVLARVALWIGSAVGHRGDVRFGLVPPLLLAGLLWSVLVLDILTGGRLQLNTVFGYSPAGGGRFAGFGNLSFALLGMTSVVLATGVWGLMQKSGRARTSSRPRRGFGLALGILAVTIVADGHPALGADVGGVIALVPTAIVVAVGLLGRRVNWRLLGAIVPATLLVLGLFAGLDLARPPESRSHLGRLVAATYAQQGGGFLTVLERKLGVNLAVLTSSALIWLVLAAIGMLVVLTVRPPGLMRGLTAAVPGLGTCLWGASVVAVLGAAFNDSGLSIPAMMLAVLVPYLVHIALQETDPASQTIESLSGALARFLSARGSAQIQTTGGAPPTVVSLNGE